MDFTCDPVKNDTNLRERGLPLLAASNLFNAAMQVVEDTRKAYPERRYIGYNLINSRLMVVVFCMPNQHTTRIISFRKANQREQKQFNP